MGVCDSLKREKGVDSIVNEVEIDGSDLKEINLDLIKVIPSVCKIKVLNQNGTGFLIKLYKNYKELFCLMTNEHVIKKKYIDDNETIYIYFDRENDYKAIRLNQSERFIKCFKNFDVTIIEIIKNDKIEEKYFLVPNLDNINVKQEIYVPQFPEGKLSYSFGVIKEISNNKLIHTASTKHGSSGSPIFLKGTTTVIGIHRQGNTNIKENYGTLIHPIIEALKDDKNNDDISSEKLNRKIINEKGEYYIGDMKNDKMHGKGKIYFKDGNIKYMGDFVNNKKEGIGQYFFENGEYYFIEDHKKFNLLYGDYYIGPWLNDKRYGIGKIYLRDGRLKYQGDFVNNKLEGYGKYIFDDGYYYLGEFLNDLQHGKGKIYKKNGNLLFQGEFIKDKIEGTGKLFFEEGGYFIGQFKNSKMHGRGKIYSKEGNILYDLNFINGQLISKEKKTTNNNNKQIEDIVKYSTYGITSHY